MSGAEGGSWSDVRARVRPDESKGVAESEAAMGARAQWDGLRSMVGSWSGGGVVYTLYLSYWKREGKEKDKATGHKERQ